MKIELINNKIFIKQNNLKHEIHPFWLRERVAENQFLDEKTQQRLFDPTTLNVGIGINKVKINENNLEINFNDGVHSILNIEKIANEFIKIDNIKDIITKIKWDHSLKTIKNFNYFEGFSESKEMYDLLVSFYKYGFAIIKNVPTENNFIVKFANSIGSVRRTNFGEHFNVKSKADPNDLAYTSLHLSPHTDNPYRNPVPCIQILHCIENEVSGGFSTLVDGFTVTERLKKDFPKYYKILTEVKIRFQFIDETVVLEDWAEMIKLDENKNFKQVRFSPRLDFVPLIDKEKLDLFYSARKKISEFYNSENYKIEFKLLPGDLLMMDNYRLLHGRTTYDANEGNRFLQGCYIDYDSTEGRLKHLKRKFNY